MNKSEKDSMIDYSSGFTTSINSFVVKFKNIILLVSIIGFVLSLIGINKLSVENKFIDYDKITYNNEGNLTTMTNAAKRNLKTYLSQYRMLTDAINIKDGFVVNIGIDFDITVLPNNNSKEVLLRCIDAFKTEFNTDNMSFYSSIILKDLYVMLASVKGVQSVLDIKIYNKFYHFTSFFDILLAFVNLVNYKIYMDDKLKNTENEAQIIRKEDLTRHNEKGIYMRDDHCDWGSSGMEALVEQINDGN